MLCILDTLWKPHECRQKKDDSQSKKYHATQVSQHRQLTIQDGQPSQDQKTAKTFHERSVPPEGENDVM
ncbi:hypothetical protein HOLleu_19271 [Holothuria leucospilota]|uniref:Uncharacterized protein n=1 Tax=Holothuria leucospilota TaxID=206669 RepID=A0A9Q1BZE7_HOLLE|nr:hypothetical protein HOLleu_19271 [Holothuria leucospilota]